MIRDRETAAFELAERLKQYKGQQGVVLAVPRGGVPVAAPIARALHMPLEVALSKKIGHPSNPEYAIGAVSLDSRALNPQVKVPEAYVEQETGKIREELQRRYQLFMGNKKPASLHNRIVIIVDDGIATGQTLFATVDLVKKQSPRKIVVAVPVAPPSAIEKLKTLVDEVICLLAPPDFYAVGQFYQDFQQVSDEEVIELLRETR